MQVLDALVVRGTRASRAVQAPSDELVAWINGINDGCCILLKACSTSSVSTTAVVVS
jgi:hypothetical protein